jgi:hypothetical protein
MDEHQVLEHSWGKELSHLTQAHQRGGVYVVVRCYEVGAGARHRFEIYLDGSGQRAVVDVPGSEAATLPQRVEQALEGFIATVTFGAGGAPG